MLDIPVLTYVITDNLADGTGSYGAREYRVRLACPPWLSPDPAPVEPPVVAPRPALFCNHPHCDSVLERAGTSGVCREHLHSDWCVCPGCEKRNRGKRG